MRLIDADALIFALETQDYSGSPESLEGWTPQDLTKAEIVDINKAPTIDAEPIKVGHWIEKGKGVAECDVCNQQNLYRQDGKGVVTKYCPSCGARMEW